MATTVMETSIMEKTLANIVRSKRELNGIQGMAVDFAAHTPVEKASTAAADGPRSDDEVRVVSIDEYAEVTKCLAEAFAKDLVARYFYDTPDCSHWTEEEKWALHVRILEYVTYAHILNGLVTTVGPNYDAVALWMPPGRNIDDLMTIFRSGLWRLNYQLSSEGKKRFFNEFMPLLHDTKTATLGARDDEAWYLVYLGTKPSARGKGYARKLIEHVTAMADGEQRPVYLESSNPNNPPIYRKFGFQERRTVHLQRAEKDIQLDIMVREPRPIGMAEKAQ